MVNYSCIPFLSLFAATVVRFQESNYFLLLFSAGMIVFRLFLYWVLGEIQTLAYYKNVGRIDQSILGILAYQYRELFRGKHVIALVIFMCFAGFTGFLIHWAALKEVRYSHFRVQSGFTWERWMASPRHYFIA
jgi:hypothetical protein